MSNQLEVILPLRTDDISLPEQKVGDADDGLYSEFVKLREDPANEAGMNLVYTFNLYYKLFLDYIYFQNKCFQGHLVTFAQLC